MEYTLKEDLLRKGHRCRPGGIYSKASITIHSTGNSSSTAAGERAWLDNAANTRDASWHYVVSNGTVIQAIPDEEEAWHCGNTDGNRHSIGIEICESGDRKAVLMTAAVFVADLLKKYGWGIERLKKHHDWTGKNCPRILIDKDFVLGGMDWEWFIKAVKSGLEEKMEKRYNTISELPSWAKATIQKLVNEGKIADGNRLDMSEDMLRVLVIMNR